MNRRQLHVLTAASTLGLLAPRIVEAQDKVMRILVGFPPGGSADLVARLMTDAMKAALDQNVIVDDRPGAAGRVALGEVKRAAPDGNTLVLAPSGALVILPWLLQERRLRPGARLHADRAGRHVRLRGQRRPARPRAT